MLLSKLKKSIAYRLSAEKKLPTDDVLQDLVQEATIYVANRCDPAELLRTSTTDCTILKMIEGGAVIIEPDYPDFSNENMHIQIDEVLASAVMNYVCFLITFNPAFKQIADEDIAVYRSDSSRVLYGDDA